MYKTGIADWLTVQTVIIFDKLVRLSGYFLPFGHISEQRCET